MSSHDDGSAASSYDSGQYGDVARAGVSRMYVLTHSALSPLDQSVEYQSERTANEDNDGDAKAASLNARLTGTRRRYDDLEDEYGDHDGVGPDRFQLLYMNGPHYFHGTISLPDGLGDDQTDERDGEADSDSEDSRPTRKEWRSSAADSIKVDDLALLLPHFQQHQDELTCIDHVSHFRHELRDVIYQMEEVGEFMVEELSKDKIIDRLEEGAKEFHWLVSPQNPTFFELQTYPHTNESFEVAGVVLIVLKIVVRGVLLDVIYHKDSYFITLRENADELALEDTFIPNLSCVGPCFLVRRYSDDDIKQLVLWCSFPPTSELVVEGRSPTQASQRSVEQRHLPAKTTPHVLKVAPVRSHSPESILEANDSQLYCVLRTSSQKKLKHRPSTRKREQLEEDQDEDDEDADQECSVVFQFNQYVYSGSARLRLSAINDLGRLSSDVLPSLKAQAFESLVFYGSLVSTTDPTQLPVAIQWMAHVRRRFGEIAGTLMEIVNESQLWVERFLAEVDAAARESATSPESVAWLGAHLRGWLDNADGVEYFFELETCVSAIQLWGIRVEEGREEMKSSDISLMLWKGVVNQVVVVVVYRRGSFFIVLRELKDVTDMPRDGLEFFGLLPELDSKGRGYLVRNFPAAIGRRSQQWLSGAKLLLWQTTGSVVREDLVSEDAQAKWLRSPAKQSEEKETSAWIEEKEDEKPRRRGDGDAVRHAVRVADDGEKPLSSARSTSPVQHPRDKSGKRHHLAPLNTGARSTGDTAQKAPWDLRTGRPV